MVFVKKSLWFIFLILISFLYLYKLDNHYFFTDEILYTGVGEEYISGEYLENLQHPLLGKFPVGFMTLFTQTDVFWLRFPYALMGIISFFIVFKILREFFDENVSWLGALLYATSPFIFETTRMVMFEAPMHLFWLLFHLFFIRLFTKSFNLKHAVLSGICMGLALGTKSPSVILILFSFLVFIGNKKINKENIKNIMIMYLSFGITFFASYLPLIITRGFAGIKDVIRINAEVLIGRNQEGKIHVVAGSTYLKSPWWFYIYNIFTKYNFSHAVISLFSIIGSLFIRSFYTSYWILFLILTTVFYQLIPLKNARYIAGIEIPAVFLTVGVINYLRNLPSTKKYFNIVLLIMTVIILNNCFGYLIQKPTKYKAITEHFKQVTQNYSKFERIYLFGSIRSARWHTRNTPEDLYVFRKDFDLMCVEFNNFTYIVFDKDELLKAPNNMLYNFVINNINSFKKSEMFDFVIYTRKPNINTYFQCPV